MAKNENSLTRMMKESNIAVVIVTFNPNKWIRRCLSDLGKSTRSADLFMVDNASNDFEAWRDVIEQFEPKWFIRSPRNLGFGGANNIAIREILKRKAYDFIFLLNQDAYVFRDTISILERAAHDFPDFSLLSPVHLGSNPNELDVGFFNYIKASTDFIESAAISNRVQSVVNVPFVNAAAWFVPVATFEKVGLFNPSFFHYGEDVNFCDRVEFFQGKIGISMKSQIIHDRSNRGVSKYQGSQAELDRQVTLYFSNPTLSQSRTTWIVQNFKPVLTALSFRVFLRKIYALIRMRHDVSDNRQKSMQVGAFGARP